MNPSKLRVLLCDDASPLRPRISTTLPNSPQLPIACAAQDSRQSVINLKSSGTDIVMPTASRDVNSAMAQLPQARVPKMLSQLATEISDKCREGQSSQLEVDRGLPAQKLSKFFDRCGSVWQIKPELKSLINFRKLDLTAARLQLGKSAPAFIRDVLVYLNQTTKSAILKRVRNAMRDDGYLFLGSVESTIRLGVPFQREEIDASICYRPTGK